MSTQTLYRSAAGEQAIQGLYDAALARWPVPCDTRHVSTRHGDTFVIACGDHDAPPLVLLHGAGSCSAIWAADTVKYSRKHRVYAIDLLGEAGKSAPNRPAWEGPAYAEWLLDVFDALQIQRPTLIGISQGSWTALKFATLYPERAGRLVLLCPGGITRDKLSFVLRAAIASFKGRASVEQMTQSLFGDLPAPPEAVEVVRLMMLHFRSRMGVLPLFSDAELRRLTMPVMLLLGEKDGLRPSQKIALRMQRLLPHLVTAMIPKAGHVLLDTVRLIMPFLAATEMQVGQQDPGRYDAFVALGMAGQPQDVDQLMRALAEQDDLPTLKLADFALGLVNTPQGSARVGYYLLNGSVKQRNYAALYFKRRGNQLVLSQAFAKGVIDQAQAYSE
jgi:pimeloyl-ACP methyl ester carboxylesterase